MKKYIIILLLFIVSWCWISETITDIKTHNIIDVKYAEEPVDLFWFSTFNTEKSSFIEEAYYNSWYLILNLSWTYYHWCDVPEYIWEEFKSSETLWWYYNKYIRWDYACYDLKAKQEEEEKKAEEERIAREKEERDRIEKAEEIRLQQQQLAKKQEYCQWVWDKANAEIEKIKAQAQTPNCDKVKQYDVAIAEVERKMNNASREASNMYKWDVPQYIVNATTNNIKEKYKDQIRQLQAGQHVSVDLCHIELDGANKLLWLIDKRQKYIEDAGC